MSVVTNPRRALLLGLASGALFSGIILFGVLQAGVQLWPAPAAQEQLPRLANGKPDFSGIWQSLSAADYDLEPHHHRVDAPPDPGIVEGGSIPYLPAARAQREKNFANRLQADPALKGFTLGVPRGLYYPAPIQLLQRERDLTVLHQFGHSVRTIHTNGSGHPHEPNDWWLGDSRAHWDGDTLVVSVKHFNGETWLDRSGNFASDGLSIVERWRLLDANTIEYKATLTDPNVYSKPWSISLQLHRHREPGFQLVEDYRYTLDYERYYPYPAARGPQSSAAAPAAKAEQDTAGKSAVSQAITNNAPTNNAPTNNAPTVSTAGKSAEVATPAARPARQPALLSQPKLSQSTSTGHGVPASSSGMPTPAATGELP